MEKNQDSMEKKKNEISYGINNYITDNIRNDTPHLFPYDPQIKYQNSGLYKNNDQQFIDVNSEILNITRPLSNDPSEKWMPGMLEPINQEEHLKYGLFRVKNNRLDNPTMELRGRVKNRWIELHQDPQENSIEPFERNGINTHLKLVDHYKC